MEENGHIERARRAYQSFILLSQKMLIEDAFSRGYYTILHLGFALLLRSGESLPKTHAGLVAKLWSSKERLGIEKDMIKQISRFQALRESGDYAAVPAVTKNDVKDVEQAVKYFFKILGEKP